MLSSYGEIYGAQEMLPPFPAKLPPIVWMKSFWFISMHNLSANFMVENFNFVGMSKFYRILLVKASAWLTEKYIRL